MMLDLLLSMLLQVQPAVLRLQPKRRAQMLQGHENAS
jgi:hypothetical protein